ncbi:MAG: flagellar hook-length control protein FliK, partial [Burkholderiaceae bacterium]
QAGKATEIPAAPAALADPAAAMGVNAAPQEDEPAAEAQACEAPAACFTIPPWLAMMIPASAGPQPPSLPPLGDAPAPAGTGAGGSAQQAASPGFSAAPSATPFAASSGTAAATASSAPASSPAPAATFSLAAAQSGPEKLPADIAQRIADLAPPAPLSAGAAPLGSGPAMTAAPLAAEPPPAQHQAFVASHPLSSTFAGDIATELNILARDGLQTAELHLNPVELGPIRIELSVSNQQAEIHFAAAHATTREGLEQSLPALREMLSSQGLSLGHAGVAADTRGDNTHGREDIRTGPSAGRGGSGPTDAPPLPMAVRVPRGMLDLYA